jgi:hypothetical protein
MLEVHLSNSCELSFSLKWKEKYVLNYIWQTEEEKMFFFVGENKRTCVCVHGEMTLLSECRQFQFFTSKWTRQLSLNVNAILSYLSLESKHWNLNAKRLLICIICYKNFRIFVNCETRSFKFYITMKENMFYFTIFSM